MVTLHQTEIDGVRCFWVETGRPTLAAHLIFRQGMVDEPLLESGWLHLLEHLALHDRDRQSLQINGSVSLLETSFDAHGPAELVADHLSGVTGWLSAPEFGQLDRERKVLRAEGDLRAGPTQRALGWRYGATGPGVAAYQEPALGAATPELLAERAAAVFTQGNAVLALDGPPPPGLRLNLSEGELLPASDATAIEEKTPAAYVDGAGVVVSGVVERGPHATFVPDLLQRQLTERLRNQEGGSYAPWATYERVDETRAVVIAGSDVHAQGRGSLAGGMWSLLQGLATNGAPRAHLDDAIALRRQALHDPYAAYGVALQAAHFVLNGRAPLAFDELVTELDATSPDDVQREVAHFLDSLLIGLPPETTWNEQWQMVTPATGSPRLQGRRFRSIGWPASKDELVIGASGVEVRADSLAQTYEVTELEGVLAFEDGARHLVRGDGYGISIEPALWRGGQEAVAALDDLVPAHLMLPQPRREPAPTFDTPGWFRRWSRFAFGGILRPGVRFASWVVLIVGVLVAAEVGLAALALYMGSHPDSEVAQRLPAGVLAGLMVAIPAGIVAVIDAAFDVWKGPQRET